MGQEANKSTVDTLITYFLFQLGCHSFRHLLWRKSYQPKSYKGNAKTKTSVCTLNTEWKSNIGHEDCHARLRNKTPKAVGRDKFCTFHIRFTSL